MGQVLKRWGKYSKVDIKNISLKNYLVLLFFVLDTLLLKKVNSCNSTFLNFYMIN